MATASLISFLMSGPVMAARNVCCYRQSQSRAEIRRQHRFLRTVACQQSSAVESALRLQPLINIAKSLGHGSHELQREVGRWLDEEQKALFVNRRDAAVGFGNRCDNARLFAE